MNIVSSARSIAFGFLLSFGLITPVVAASSDYYLKIDGIDGESRIEPGAIDITAFTYDVVAPRDRSSGLATGKRKLEGGSVEADIAAKGGTGMGTGKVSLQDFHFVKVMDKSSPKLFEGCAKGKHFANVVLTCRKAGSEQGPYLKYELKDVLISSYAPTADNNDDKPMEQISLNFSKITVSYTVPGDSGGLETFSFTYDLAKNK